MMNEKIEFRSNDKDEWLKNHTLSKEQFQQLILNKINRAKQDQLRLAKSKHLVKLTD